MVNERINMRTKVATLITMAALCGAAWADDIGGTIKLAVALSHGGTNTISSLSESVTDPWKWSGDNSSIGTNGSESGMTRLYLQAGTLTSLGTNTIDLQSATVDSFGNALAFTKVKFIWFCPTIATAPYQSLIIRPATAAGLTNWTEGTSGVKVQSGGIFAYMAPNTNAIAVAAGACDSLEIVNTVTNSASYSLYIGGM
jgi:hypothetical protein